MEGGRQPLPEMLESRSWRALVRMAFSMSVSVWSAVCGVDPLAGGVAHLLVDRDVQPVGAQAGVEDVDRGLEAFVRLLRVGIPVGDDHPAVGIGRGQGHERQGVQARAPQIAVDADIGGVGGIVPLAEAPTTGKLGPCEHAPSEPAVRTANTAMEALRIPPICSAPDLNSARAAPPAKARSISCGQRLQLVDRRAQTDLAHVCRSIRQIQGVASPSRVRPAASCAVERLARQESRVSCGNRRAWIIINVGIGRSRFARMLTGGDRRPLSIVQCLTAAILRSSLTTQCDRRTGHMGIANRT